MAHNEERGHAFYYADNTAYYVHLAQRLLREGRATAALAALKPRSSLTYYEIGLEKGALMSLEHMMPLLRVVAQAYSSLGDEVAGARIVADADETEAIIRGSKHGLYDGLLAELRAEQAAEAAAAGGGASAAAGGQVKKKKKK